MSKTWYPIIDRDACIGCGACVAFCQHGVYKASTETACPDVAYPIGCVHGCKGCEVRCPCLPSEYSEDWGIPDPTGKGDDEFKKAIAEIERRVLMLKERLAR